MNKQLLKVVEERNKSGKLTERRFLEQVYWNMISDNRQAMMREAMAAKLPVLMTHFEPGPNQRR